MRMAERFWVKVNRRGSDDCWLWTAGSSRHGYGVFRRTKERDGMDLAHRVSWTIANGEIPDGMSVLHHCDVKRCCNPAHLFLGTQADNMADMSSKGRHVGGRRLSWEDVADIRSLAGLAWQKDLASAFGVTRTNVTQIINGRTWSTSGT